MYRDLIHAAYAHKPDEPGIFTVCGASGRWDDQDLTRVNCQSCLDTIAERWPRTHHRILEERA